MRKQEFFIPVVLILKALYNVSDRELYDVLVGGDINNTFLTDRIELMLHESHHTKLNTQSDILIHLGQMFRALLRPSSTTTDYQCGQLLLNTHFFIHCYHSSSQHINNQAKFNVLIHMIKKTYSLASGQLKADNPDALSNQEIMLPGHLYLMILKEKLQVCTSYIVLYCICMHRVSPAVA